jgi:acyl-coenzyme A synthetase/AMP-(fatty) acid ligase
VPGVGRAVVVPRDFGHGDVRLVAHLLPARGADGDGLAAAAERHAGTSLPRHLRPSVYKVVTEIPMTLQGKVDRDALGQ